MLSNWPAQSPDLNPIEHAWRILKDKIQARSTLPKNGAELIAAIQESWETISLEQLNQIIASMPRRIQAVIKAKGGPTKY